MCLCMHMLTLFAEDCTLRRSVLGPRAVFADDNAWCATFLDRDTGAPADHVVTPEGLVAMA
jgi:hypothetical protein